MTAPITYSIEEIQRITGGQWISKAANEQLDFISLDSRKIPEPSKTVFWALRTPQRDASVFIIELYSTGVRNFVAEAIPVEKLPADINLILVKDAVKALQLFAVFHRKKFPGLKVIGITGSNGKTIVKEWLAALLFKDFQVVKSPRSFNSQIGVPLSILQIRAHHEIGIFEAGISKPGEMAALEKMIQPQTGVLTNIGSAHDEGFENRRQKIYEKLLLFKNCKAIIFPATVAVQRELQIILSSKQLLDWGKKNAAFTYKSIKQDHHDTTVAITNGNKTYDICIPHSDAASIENAVSCFCTLASLDCINAQILERFHSLSHIAMRLEMKPGIHQCSIINDSYSNDLQSLAVAVDFLNKQKHQPHTLILSDIFQSGLQPGQLYKQVAAIITGKKIEKFIGIGKEISNQRHQFAAISNAAFFDDTDSFLEQIATFNFKNEAILLKGARIFRFEKISKALEAKVHNTVLTINLSNLADNIRLYKQFLEPGTKLMVMVKALAYGSGSNEIASVMEFIKADYLGVAYIDEGVALREAGITLPVMVMNAEQSGFDSLVKYHLEPEIYSHDLWDAFSDFLSAKKIKNYPVHLKIDTGMHRLGFSNAEINLLIQKLTGSRAIKVASVFSHLSAADSGEHDAFTLKQFYLFKKITKKILNSLPYTFYCHISNSSAISRFPEFQMDMVRLGIGMYGIDGNPQIAKQLKPVHRLTATISQIKKVKAGEVVGYGNNQIENDKTIATVAIGYADGYTRLLSNGRGSMYLYGQLAPVVGNVCMDMTMIDISGIEGAEAGDEVEVFGENIPLKLLAKWAKTIPYEIITGISTRVKRVYIEG